MAARPNLFIGSSSEAIETAHKFRASLHRFANGIVWDEAPEFELSSATLESLVKAAKFYDFGLFILTPDDNIESRGEQLKSARDNVIFELGLFLGAIGPERTFAVTKSSDEDENSIKKISDLAGILIPQFSTDGTHCGIASIGVAATTIGEQIIEVGPRPLKFSGCKWSFEKSTYKISAKIPKAEVQRNMKRLKGNSLCLYGRRQNKRMSFFNDPSVHRGRLRKVCSKDEDIYLCVQSKKNFMPRRPREFIDFAVALIPDDVDIKSVKTVEQLLEMGGQLPFKGGVRSN